MGVHMLTIHIQIQMWNLCSRFWTFPNQLPNNDWLLTHQTKDFPWLLAGLSNMLSSTSQSDQGWPGYSPAHQKLPISFRTESRALVSSPASSLASSSASPLTFHFTEQTMLSVLTLKLCPFPEWISHQILTRISCLVNSFLTFKIYLSHYLS